MPLRTRCIPIALCLLLAPALPAQEEGPELRAKRLNARGVELYEEKSWDEAIDHFERALRLDRDEKAIRRNLALALHARGMHARKDRRLDAALKDLRAAWEHRPEEAAVPAALASALRAVDRPADARIVLAQGLALLPKAALLHEELGRLEYEEDRLQEALDELVKAVALEKTRKARLQPLIDKIRRELAVEKDWITETRGAFTVKFQDRDFTRVAREVLDLLDLHYERLGREFGHWPRRRVSLVLYTRGDFDAATGAHGWTGALFDGKIRLPVRNFDAARRSISDTLAHELTHLFVRGLSRRCPIWLNEGLAQVHQGARADAVRSTLRKLRDEEKLPAIASLPSSWARLADGRKVRLYYAVSLSFTAWLEQRYGLPQVVWCLREIDRQGPEAAIEEAFGMNLAQLEARWRESL